MTDKIVETLWAATWEYAPKKLTTRLMTGQKNMVGMTEATSMKLKRKRK